MVTSSFFTNTSKLSWNYELVRTRNEIIGAVVGVLIFGLIGWYILRTDLTLRIVGILITIPLALLYLYSAVMHVIDLIRLLRDRQVNELPQIDIVVKEKKDIDTRHTLFRYQVFSDTGQMWYVDQNLFKRIAKGTRLRLKYYPHTRVVREYQTL